jgi:hypothetical protein
VGFWVFIALTIISIASNLLQRRPRVGAPQPASRGDFQFPTAEEGRCIPAIVGTALIEGPNVLWDGDYSTTAIVEDGQTVGYKYYLGAQYGLCLGPIDRILEMRFDGKSVRLPGFVGPSGKTLRVKNNAGASTTVALPEGTFTNVMAYCKAVAAVIATAPGGAPYSRPVYGAHIVKNQNDKITYRYRTSEAPGTWFEVSRQVGPVAYTTCAELAAAVTIACKGGPNLQWTYNTALLKYQIQIPRAIFPSTLPVGGPSGTILEFEILPAKSTILATLGLPETGSALWNTTVFPATLTAPEATSAVRFFFAVSGKIEWSHAGTNCHTVFGMNGGAADFTASKGCDLDRPQGGDTATYVTDAEKTVVTVNAPNLFGGVHQEGGIVGTFDIYHGTQAQTSNDYLTTQFGTTAPAHQGLSHVVARKPYQGDSPYLKGLTVMVERCPNSLGLEADRHRISVGGGALGDDANPACWCYELLTDPVWAMGFPTAMIDLNSFRAAGYLYYDEGLGVSYNIDTALTGQDLLDDLMRHMDAVLFPDPQTGVLFLTPIRADYDVSTLTHLHEGNISDVEMSRPGPDETKNTVKVEFVDRTDGHTTRIAQEQDLAAVQSRGYVDAVKLSYRGFTNPNVAQQVAARELRSEEFGPRRFKITCNREAWSLRPGMPFKLSWTKFSISNLVCRVIEDEPGEPRRNAIEFSAVEDIFGSTPSAFTPRAATLWTEPLIPSS